MIQHSTRVMKKTAKKAQYAEQKRKRIPVRNKGKALQMSAEHFLQSLLRFFSGAKWKRYLQRNKQYKVLTTGKCNAY